MNGTYRRLRNGTVRFFEALAFADPTGLHYWAGESAEPQPAGTRTSTGAAPPAAGAAQARAGIAA